ncbi:MAG: hypothetical protein Q9209_001022 [Squamulea sp. 1 TL-2023]
MALGPGVHPPTPSLGPSPPNSRSRFPSSNSSSSRHRLSNGNHHHEPHDRSRIQSEMHLPMHAGPPSRNSGSPAARDYADSHRLIPSISDARDRISERGPIMNGKAPESNSLPPIHQLTQPTASYMASRLPPMNPAAPVSYPQSVPPRPMDLRYVQSGGYMPHTHDPYAPPGQQVQFQNVEVGEKSNKKRRGNLPKQTTDVLRAWLYDHLEHAYPNDEQKQRLIRETGLSKLIPFESIASGV